MSLCIPELQTECFMKLPFVVSLSGYIGCLGLIRSCLVPESYQNNVVKPQCSMVLVLVNDLYKECN